MPDYKKRNTIYEQAVAGVPYPMMSREVDLKAAKLEYAD